MAHSFHCSVFTLAVAAFAGASVTAHAAPDRLARIMKLPGGVIVVPGGSIARPGDAGVVAHTNTQLFFPNTGGAAATGPYGKYETPASLACVYGLTAPVQGCNPKTLTAIAQGGGGTIAVVDAYDDPSAASDLATFSQQFGLPPVTPSNFQVVYASGTEPAQDSTGGWELEESLDVQMIHALAPKASIVLVEAASNQVADLYAAEKVAAALVAEAGGGQVTNSWGTGEYAQENLEMSVFDTQGVVFFASSGDTGGVGAPAIFPNVVAVGGTKIRRDRAGDYLGEIAWQSTGGGTSAFLPRPVFQNAVKKIVGPHRGVPDIAFDADPTSGVWVYDSIPYDGAQRNWLVVGGTSVGSPAIAAIANAAGSLNTSSAAELATIYSGLGNPANFTDTMAGKCPNGLREHAAPGYDLCTGIGTPLGLSGK